MKSIELENKNLVGIFSFLQNVPLKNQASLGKIKFMKKLQEKEEDILEAKTLIQKEYFLTNDQGELVVENDNYQFKEDITQEQKEELAEKLQELMNYTFEISFVEYSNKFEAMFESLSTLDKELVGEEALAYFELMEAYERMENKQETSKEVK